MGHCSKYFYETLTSSSKFFPNNCFSKSSSSLSSYSPSADSTSSSSFSLSLSSSDKSTSSGSSCGFDFPVLRFLGCFDFLAGAGLLLPFFCPSSAFFSVICNEEKAINDKVQWPLFLFQQDFVPYFFWYPTWTRLRELFISIFICVFRNFLSILFCFSYISAFCLFADAFSIINLQWEKNEVN